MKTYLLALFGFSLTLTACNTTAPKTQLNAGNSAPTTTEKPSLPATDRVRFNPAEVVKFSVGKPFVIQAGNTGEAEVKLSIQNPYHVNSNPPSEKSYIPLEITLNDAAGITVGKPVYPKGELKKFTFSEDKPLSVYTGEIVVKIPLKIGKTVVTGQQQLAGKLKFQPCDEEVCYRPQTVDVSLPVTIN